MDDAARERRVAELRVMQYEDPRELIKLYCNKTGQSPGAQLPYGVSFSRMIDTIVDHEALAISSQSLTRDTSHGTTV